MLKQLLSLSTFLAVSLPFAYADSGQFVRIELSGDKRVLTLSEVEVLSGGKNIAGGGKASQSSTGNGGDAKGAIDGSNQGNFQAGKLTHTNEEKNPWWELDLGQSVAIDQIKIWNRGEGLGDRLDGFTLTVLSPDRKEVFTSAGISAPADAVQIEVKKDGNIAYIDRSGKVTAMPPKPVSVPAGYKDPSPFAFQRNDVVAIIGSGVADRMQHDGWLETAIQSQLPDARLSFRNMAVSGDQPDKYPRSQGFTPQDEYLRLVRADVILAFFGYNESFDGIDKAASYQQRLVKMINTYRRTQPNGKDFPRFVLFSPIAFDNYGDPNLPTGVEHNARLAAYTDATRLAAEEAGVAFVDIYAPTFQLFEGSKTQFTINGVHLNEEGNRRLAEIIASALLNKKVAATPQLKALNDAVKDKNWYWHNRYRATDGNDIWGGRSTLRFVDGQSNADVLKHELIMLDAMTASRDQVVWAAAQGKKAEADDSKVPAPIPVKSNVGGGSKSSSAQKEGSVEYMSPEESIKNMDIPEGYALNVFASEVMFPDLANPVQMQVDNKGRLWAASWNTYPMWEPMKPMNDSLMIFPDDNHDGVADRRIIFANVHNPLGFEFWNGGVIVTAGPDLLFLKDTDGDDKADVRFVLLSGLDTSDTHHAANNMIYGPDGGIYWQSGIFLNHNYEHPWGSSLNTGNSGMYRFDPRRFTINFHAGNSPNPHGTSFDYWGYCFANDGTGGRSFQVRPDGKGFKMHELLTKEVRPVAADAIVSSTNFPDEIQGNFLVCNTIGFLGVKNYKLHRDGFAEKKMEKGQIWGTPEPPLLSSRDRNFRPTDAVFGEDGALYVSDWQNVIIGHMQHNIRDPNRDHLHGRIVRLVYKDRPLQKPVAIDGQPIAALLENLKNPIDGIRHRTRVELSERDSKEVIAAVSNWIKPFDASKADEAHHLLEGLWVYQQNNVRNEELLAKLLASPIDHARIAAGTVKHFWYNVDATSGRIETPAEDKEAGAPTAVPAHLTGADAKAYSLGAAVFSRDAHCITCHQPNGKGMAKLYPPLVDSPWVTGSEERLIKLALHGLWGKLELNGETYDPAKGIPPMTAFGAVLNDQEMAAVLTYVRNTWGNKASVINPETVAKVRKANEARTIFWKPEELLKDHPLEK